MSTITTLDDNTIISAFNAGAQLASVREQKGYTVEYVANQLKLRSRIIELIESNEFNSLPGPVFIKGYIRAYAKLLEVSPDPYLAVFDGQYVSEKKSDRAPLWQQTKRERNKAEHVIRWFTILFALGVMVAVGVWWQKNVDGQQTLFSENAKTNDLSLEQAPTTELKLTDISKMQTLLTSPKPEMTPVEKAGE